MIEDLHKNAIEYDPKLNALAHGYILLLVSRHLLTEQMMLQFYSTVCYCLCYSNNSSPKSEIPIWMLAMGGIGIMVGLEHGDKIIKRIIVNYPVTIIEVCC